VSAQPQEVVVPLAAVESPPPARPAEPVIPTMLSAAPVAFHEVSEHDDGESHRPVRRRRHGESHADTPPAPVPLQLVETQVEVAPPVMEDDTPRRTKPRRRRSAPAEGGPLQLVETQPGAQPPVSGDTPPAP